MLESVSEFGVYKSRFGDEIDHDILEGDGSTRVLRIKFNSVISGSIMCNKPVQFFLPMCPNVEYIINIPQTVGLCETNEAVFFKASHEETCS